MDNIEITVFDEIKDYKEKIYFFNIRQWIFAILIVAIVVPTYLLLKDRIGEEITGYIVIAIAGVLGFIGFVKIHELPAEKIMPYWFRHYVIFTKPIHYVTDNDYEMQYLKKKDKKNKTVTSINNEKKPKNKKIEIVKAEKENTKIKEDINNFNKEEVYEKLSKLSKEQREAFLKLLER